MKERYFENFKLYCPWAVDKVVDYQVSGYGELTVKLSDGRVLLFDDENRGVRKLPANSNKLSMNECNREFGVRLRRILQHRYMSQLELSEKTGIAPMTISRYINGKSMPSFYAVDRIAKALNCSTDEFRYVYPKGE